MKKELYADILDQAIAALGKAGVQKGSVSHEDFSIPPDTAMGDIALPCFGIAKALQKKPGEVAAKLAEKLQPTKYIASWKAAGPYLNMTHHRDALASAVLKNTLDGGEEFGSADSQEKKTIVLEYISANTNKPLHIGHLRNGLTGWSVAELLRSQGAEVVKTDIVNDRGIHIIKSMLAYQKWGNGETPGKTGEKPDHFVGRYYVLFDQEFKKEQSMWLKKNKKTLENLPDQQKAAIEAEFRSASALWKEARQMLRDWEAGDSTIRKIWKTMNDWAYAGWKVTYDELGFDFDKHYYDSEVFEKGKKIIEAAVADGTFHKAENGAVFVPLSKHSKLPDKVVLRGDGTGLYMTQDLYLANKRYDEFRFDQMLYVIGSEQKLYMEQLFATLALLKFPAANRLMHLSYGYVSLPEGRMKSREGTVVDADDLLVQMMTLATDELKKRYSDLSEDEMARRARVIALGALKFHFLLVGREQDMVFNPKEALSFEGRTGPYLQYSYARASSILRKAESFTDVPKSPTVTSDAEWAILLAVLHFPKTVERAAAQLEPSVLANHLVDLAQHFSTFYHAAPVLDAVESLRSTRLALTSAVRTVLANGLALLGIDVLEEM